jgi:hypothetical protein
MYVARNLHSYTLIGKFITEIFQNRLFYWKNITCNFPAENRINLPELYKFHIRQLYNAVYLYNTPTNANP